MRTARLLTTLIAAAILLAPAPRTQAEPPRAQDAAARAYLEAMAAFNARDADRFFGAFAADYCHYDKRLDAAGLRRLYQDQFGGKPTTIDATVEPLRVRKDEILFLQSELFGRTPGQQQRYFKLVLMRRGEAGWRIAATATRKRHKCAPKLLEGVKLARVDELKQRIIRRDLASFLPRGCEVGPSWDGRRETMIDCEEMDVVRGFKAWKLRSATDEGHSAGSRVESRTYERAGWTLLVDVECVTADCPNGEEECQCSALRAWLEAPRKPGKARGPRDDER